MKKALLILLALSIVGAAAFADVKISAFTVTGLKMTSGANATGDAYNQLYGYDYLRGFSSLAVLGFSYSGSDPNYGYDARLLYIPNFGNDFAPMMDLSQVWVKMLDGMVMFTLGQVIPNSFATPGMEWGDSAWNGGGANVTVKPIEGLEVAYQIAVPLDGSAPVISDAFANSKIGASYSMKDMFDIKGAFLMDKAEKQSDAYAGFSLTAVPGLGLWVELLMVNIGDTTAGGGETDIFVMAEYAIMEGLAAGVAFEYNMPAFDWSATMNSSNFVVEPYVSYVIMEKVTLTGGADFGTGDFGWYGLQTGGVTVTKDGLLWAAFAKVDFASPVGNIRVKAQYKVADTKLDKQNQFYVYAGFKWSL